eukprot:TRINITY_DN8248_c2_g3_i1.p1 TRINITY_DN8248_c2_g3~~TRINITY_DN8248_c2_g3_i1.p1  ORF type:complete len:1188 (+),score=235.83 TRINITY_DN8248_c2_g3_i1:49-3612(+)
MVEIVTTVKNTFVHVDDGNPDVVETDSNARRRASSAPARVALDREENEKFYAQAFGAQGSDELLLLPHDADDYTSMHSHPGPSPLDMDVEGMFGSRASETDVDDDVSDRSIAQAEDETASDYVTVNMEIDDTLRFGIIGLCCLAEATQRFRYFSKKIWWQMPALLGTCVFFAFDLRLVQHVPSVLLRRTTCTSPARHRLPIAFLSFWHDGYARMALHYSDEPSSPTSTVTEHFSIAEETSEGVSNLALRSHTHVHRQLEHLQQLDLSNQTKSQMFLRDTLSRFERDNTEMKHKLEGLESLGVSLKEALMQVKVNHNTVVTELNDECDARKALKDHCTKEYDTIRSLVDDERKNRANGDDSVMADFRNLIRPMKSSLDCQSRNQQDMAADMKRMQDTMKTLQMELGRLHDLLAKETNERKHGEAQLLDTIRSHRDSTNQEWTKHVETHKSAVKELRGHLEKHKADNDSLSTGMQSEITWVKRELKPHMQQVLELERKLKELDERTHSGLSDQKIALDKVATDVNEMPRRFQNDLEKNVKALNNTIEENEQMVTRLRKDVREQHSQHQESVRALQEAMDRHTSNQEPIVEELRCQVKEMKRDFQPHVTQIPTLESKVNEIQEMVGPFMKDHGKVATAVTGVVEGMQRHMESRIAELVEKLREESSARKSFETSVHPQLQDYKRTLDRMAEDVSRIPERVEEHLQEGAPMRAAIRDDAAKLVSNLRAEIHDKGHEDKISELKKGLEMHGRHGSDIDDLKGKLTLLHQEMKPHVEKAPLLHSKVKELEDIVHPQLREHQISLERLQSDVGDNHKMLDRKVQSAFERIDREEKERQAMLDEHEQSFGVFKANIRANMNDHASTMRKDKEDLQQQLRKELEMQAASHDDKLTDLKNQINSEKKTSESRLETISRSLTDLERKMSEKNDDGVRRLVGRVDELHHQLRDFTSTFETQIKQEKDMREETVNEVEENIEGFKSMMREFGERIMSSGDFRAKPKRNVTVRRSQTDSYIPSALSTRAWNADETSEKTTLSEEPTTSRVPSAVMNVQDRFRSILAHGQLELEGDVDVAQLDERRDFRLRPKKRILFEDHHFTSDSPAVTEFNDPKSARETLQDVIAILNLYPLANLRVEAYPSALNGSSDDVMVKKRAEKVMETLKSMGVSERRMTCVETQNAELRPGEHLHDLAFVVIQ